MGDESSRNPRGIANARKPRSGDMVAALVDGESTLKTCTAGKRPRLCAANSEYRDIKPDRELVIQGVMIGKFPNAK